jgi:hypothetical protein
LQLQAESVQFCFSLVFIVTPFVLDESPAAARDLTAPGDNDTPPRRLFQAVRTGKTPQNKLKKVRIRHCFAACPAAYSFDSSPAARPRFSPRSRFRAERNGKISGKTAYPA